MPDIASISTVPVTAAAPTPDAGASSRPGPGSVPRAQAAEPPAPPRTPDALQQQLDRILEEADTSLRFRVDAQSRRIVVSVLAGRGEVVMQIPDDTALAIARRLAATGSLLDLRA